MASLQGEEALRARFQRLQKTPEVMMRQLGTLTVREAKLLVPRRTGNLGRTIHVAQTTPTSVEVVASASYARPVEFGSRPHEITPRAKKALRFAASASGRRLTGSPRKGAQVVFAKRVHHPGTRPHPYLVPGAKEAVRKAGVNVVVKLWDGEE